MSVNLKFGTDGEPSIVAEGSYLWDAARRVGVRLPAECGGTGQCDTCAVVVNEGMNLLSPLTEAERQHLNAERLAMNERLACQVKIERAGDLTVTPVPVAERDETSEETVDDFRRNFRKLSLDKKIRALTEFEVVTAYQTLNAIAGVPSYIGGKIVEVLAGRGRTLDARERDARRPADHEAKPNATSGEATVSTDEAFKK